MKFLDLKRDPHNKKQLTLYLKEDQIFATKIWSRIRCLFSSLPYFTGDLSKPIEAKFLSLGTVDILTSPRLTSPVQYGVLGSISGLCSQDTSNTLLSLPPRPVVTIKNVSRRFQMCLRREGSKLVPCGKPLQ